MDTRQTILATAFRLFHSHGYSNISINDVIREVGLTKGGFYHHFNSKAELYRECLEKYFFSVFDRFFNEKPETTLPVEEFLKYLVNSLLRFYEESAPVSGEGRFNGFYTLIFQDINEFKFIRERMKVIYAQMARIVSEVLNNGKASNQVREDIDCDATALHIVALLEGISLMRAMDNSLDVQSQGDLILSSVSCLAGI
jgi:AcrR family transcriptional regulator